MQFWPRITPDICIYVCMYICMHVHICVYTFCTFVYLYLLVYNWFKRGYFNIFLIYFELGKDACIFLHSFILWQIDTYWLALSTFKRNSDIYWRLPCWLGYSRKKSKTGAVAEDGGTFLKNPWNFRFVTLPLEIVNSREKKGSSPEILQNCGTLFLLLGNSNKAKNQDPWKLRMIFLDSWSPLDTTLLF